MLYWPWFDRRLATRLDVDIPSASSLHEDVLDTLRAGTRYDLAPNAVFRYDPLPAIQELNLPITLMAANRTARSRGASVEWLTRLLAHASSAVVERYSIEPCLMAHQLEPDSTAYREYATQVERILAGAGARAGGIGAAPRVADTAPVAEGLWRSYVETDRGQVLVRRGGDGRGRPLLLLHDIARSGASLAGLAVELAADRPVLVPDLAGFGDSDPPRDRRSSIEDYVAPIRAVLEAVGIAEVDVYGAGTGALVATELAAQDPRVQSVILDDPPIPGATTPPEGGAPSLEPCADGTHLLRAWNRVRDSALFSPWYRTSRDAIRWSEPDDAATLQARTLELLKGAAEERPARLATARYPAVERLRASSARTLVIEDSTDAGERVASFLGAASA